MKLGFVGVGKHAQKMAKAFRECEAEIVAYDRQSTSAPASFAAAEGFGERRPWREMVTSKDIDAIVCCAPPDVTAEVFRATSDTTMPVVLTKPLIGVETWPDASNRRYVDLWRLYSPAWRALKSELAGREIKSVHVDFYGNGPVRTTHSGLLDYAPHALAFVLDLGFRQSSLSWSQQPSNLGQWSGLALSLGARVSVATGSRFTEPKTQVTIETDAGEHRWWEREGEQGYEFGDYVWMCHRTDLALRNFCRAFLAGEPSDTLRISCEAMRLLAQAGPEGRIVPQ